MGRAIFILVCLGLLMPWAVRADDTVCATTLSNGGLVDIRQFPTTPGDTVLNGRNDGSTAICTVFTGGSIGLDYPNGLTINSRGTGIHFRGLRADIRNGLVINDDNIGQGLVIFEASNRIEIQGNVRLENRSKVRFITHNTASSTTRLDLSNAHFNVESGSELQAELKIGDTTGSEFLVGSLGGGGNLRLLNVGKSNGHGGIYVQHPDGRSTTFSGDILYEGQSTPSLYKRGAGKFTFTGDVKRVAGDTVGFTDGFDLVYVEGGQLETTTDAFVFGTRVFLEGGDLILNQSFDATLSGTTFSGTSNFYKRGSGKISLEAIDSRFKGSLFLEEGTLALIGSANLADVRDARIGSGTTLDLSGIGSSTRVARISGTGTINLGDKDLGGIVRIRPGPGIGTLNITGTGTTNLSGTLVEAEIDPLRAAGNVPGVTSDHLEIQGPVSIGVSPLIKLFDVQRAGSPSAFLNGREFTIISAGSGLKNFNSRSVIEDTASFHAFIGADPETTVVTDSEVRVRFGIKTANQVVAAVGQNQVGGTPSSTPNKTNATAQHLSQSLGVTGNQRPTIQQLESSAWRGVTTDTLTLAAGNNNPEAYSSNLTLGLEGADLMAMMVRDQIRPGIDRPADSKAPIIEDRLWVDTAYVRGTVDGTDSLTGNFDYHLAGVVAGTDLYRSHSTLLGAYLGGIFSDLKEHDHIDQEFDNNYVYAGLYSQFELGNDLYFNALLSLFYGDHETDRRNLDIRGGAGTISSSSFDSYGGSIGLELEKLYEIGEFGSAVPSIGFLYTALEQESILESGGGREYDYQIQRADAHAAVFSAGVDLIRQFDLPQGPLTGTLRLNYEYDAFADRNSEHDIAASLVGQSATGFVGQNRGPHGFLAGVGCQWDASSQVSIGGGYLYSLRSAGHENSFGLNCRIRW